MAKNPFKKSSEFYSDVLEPMVQYDEISTDDFLDNLLNVDPPGMIIEPEVQQIIPEIFPSGLPMSGLFFDYSELNIPADTRIIALSDIHGDIDALIIALRDCAKVIQPRSNIPSELNQTVKDPLLVELLNLPITDNNTYDYFSRNANLNFNWIGTNTHVVIVGDIIDPFRPNHTYIEQTTGRNVNNNYPQIEFKILKFLNKLDEYARVHGGRVIKLLGNHEFTNLIPGNDYTPSYSHDVNETLPYLDATLNVQFITRLTYFNINQPGFELLKEGGIGVFVKINNNIFMHGQIYNMRDNPEKNRFEYNYCHEFNRRLNNNLFTHTDPFFLDFGNAPQLWDRDYGLGVPAQFPLQQSSDYVSRRLVNNTPGDRFNKSNFCEGVKSNIFNFLRNAYVRIMDDIRLREYVNTCRVIIGHCTQYDYTYNQQINRTLTTQTPIDYRSVALSTNAETLNLSYGENINRNHVFGITMECPHEPSSQGNDLSNSQHHIYKVDVGVSRAFDNDRTYNVITHTEPDTHFHIKRKLLSRVPQVLELSENSVRIIRSTLKNTRYHQERHIFENLINSRTHPASQLRRENMTYGGYKEKYLKYKQKYLELKNKINY
jgi:hypothetical protein